jgi:regulator of sigma E protease
MVDFLQSAAITLGSFVVVLSLVVFVHEFGHFRVGRWCGISVKSFSIGLGSEWFGWTDKHGTRWKVSKIPLGGFVSWIDDTDGSSTLPATEENQALSSQEARRLGHFRAMPVWKRALTVAAGPVTNFVFAIFAFALLGMIFGRDLTEHANVRVQFGDALDGSAAQAAGLRAGEIVEEVDARPMRGVANFIAFVDAHGGRSFSLTLSHADGGRRTVQVTPQVLNGGGRLGISVGENPAEVVVVPVDPLGAIPYGAAKTWEIVARTGDYIGGVFTGKNSGRDIAGPIGIMNASGQVTSAALGASADNLGERVATVLLALLGWAAVLSVAVGIVNLLPIPVLDGGHLLFYGIEAVRGGRPLPPLAQEWAYRAGFAAMASLFLFATWNDISRLFPGAR